MGPLVFIAYGWLACISSVAFWAHLRSAPSRRTGRSRGVPLGRIVIVRPCAGAEPHLQENLLSTEALLRSPHTRLRVAIAGAGDAAFPAASRAVEVLAGKGYDAALVPTFAVGPNRKADQIGKVLGSLPCDVVVVVDSDIDLASASLDPLLTPLEDESIAAVWAPPVEVSPETVGDYASAALLDSSLHAFSLLGALDARGLVGKAMAIRRGDLDALGGFESLRSVLGEDMEIARRLQARGRKIACIARTVHSRTRGRTTLATIERYARWLTVVRTQRPLLFASYPLLLAAAPLLFLLSVVCAFTGGVAAYPLLVLVPLHRLLVGLSARTRSGSPRSWRALPLDIVLADGLLLAAVVLAAVSRRVRWRGASLQVRAGGRLTAEGPR